MVQNQPVASNRPVMVQVMPQGNINHTSFVLAKTSSGGSSHAAMVGVTGSESVS